MRKHKKAILIHLTSLTIALGLSILFMSLDGQLFNPPITIKVDHFTTTQTTYHPGDKVQAITSFCKNRDIDGVARWALVDTYIKIFPLKLLTLPVGCYTDKIVTLATIPDDSYSDTYHLEGTFTYRVNILSTFTIPVKTNSFQVIKNNPAK